MKDKTGRPALNIIKALREIRELREGKTHRCEVCAEVGEISERMDCVEKELDVLEQKAGCVLGIYVKAFQTMLKGEDV